MIAVLDSIRAKTLRFTMRNDTLRAIFKSQTRRHALLFLFAIVTNITFAIFLPEYLFWITPLLLGPLHVLSSLSFSGSSKQMKIGILSTLIAASLFIACFQYFGFYGTRAYIGVTVIASILRMVQLKKATFPLLKLSALIGLATALCLLLYYFSMVTVLSLIIIHNFVGFFYWRSMTVSNNQKQLCLRAGLLTLFISGFFFIIPSHYLPDQSLVQSFFQNEFDSPFFSRLFLVFIFTQAIHYLVWVKIIPEITSGQKIALSFRQCWRGLRKNTGFIGTVGVPVITVALLLFCAWRGVSTARELYVNLSFFHGFNEIMGLPFLCIVHSYRES